MNFRLMSEHLIASTRQTQIGALMNAALSAGETTKYG